MDSTVAPTPPKFPQDFMAPFLDRIDRGAAEVRAAALQPDDLARPGLHEMADADLDEVIRPRVSRGFVLFLIVFSIGVGAILAWQLYGDAARAMIATSLAPEPASVPQAAPAAPQATASPELQQLKEDLAQLKQEFQQLKEMPAALASLRQSVDQLAGSQQEIAGKVAKLSTQKPASPPRPAPAPKPLTPSQAEVR